MNSQDTVRNWLGELSELGGLGRLTLNENGIGTFAYGEDLTVSVIVPADSELVQLLAPLVSPPQENRETYFAKLLQLNFLTLETNGATFALDKETGEVVLCYSQPIGALDLSQGFRNLLGSFIEAAEKWSSCLGSAEFASTESVDNTESQEIAIRV
jgi:hypothetical protein